MVNLLEMARGRSELSQAPREARGMTTQEYGRVSSQGEVLATPEDIKRAVESGQVSQLRQESIQRSYQQPQISRASFTQPEISRIVDYGTSSLDKGYIDTSGQQLATSQDIRQARDLEETQRLREQAQSREEELKRERLRQDEKKLKETMSKDFVFKTLSGKETESKQIVESLKPGDFGYKGSEELGTTRTTQEAIYDINKLIGVGQTQPIYEQTLDSSESKEDTIGKIIIPTQGQPGYVSPEILASKTTFKEDWIPKKSDDIKQLELNIKNVVESDKNIDVTDRESVYELVEDYKTTKDYLDVLESKTKTSMDAALLLNTIDTNLKKEGVSIKDFKDSAEQIKDIVITHTNMDTGFVGEKARDTKNIRDFADVLLQAESKKEFDNLIKESEFYFDLNKNIKNLSYSDKLKLLSKTANVNKGVLADEEKQVFILDTLSTISDEEVKKLENEKNDIISSINKQMISTENKLFNTKLNAKETVKDIISDKERNKQLKEEYANKLSESTQTEYNSNDITDLQLARYIIEKDYINDYNDALSKLRSSDNGYYETKVDESGNEIEQFFYYTQEGVDKEEKLNKEYNSKISNFNKDAINDLNEYGYQQEEIDKITQINQKINNIRDLESNTAEDVKGMDIIYSTKQRMLKDISETRFDKDQSVLGTLWKKGAATAGEFVVGSSAAISKLPYQILSEPFKTKSVSDILYTPSEKYELGEKYDVTYQTKRIGEAAKFGGVAALGTASGGTGFIATLGAGLVTVPTIAEASRQIAYRTAPESIKESALSSLDIQKAVQSGMLGEDIAIGKGWDKKTGGFDATIRGFLGDVPGFRFIPGVGSKEAYAQAAKEYYEQQGLTGKELDDAVNMAYRQRTAGMVGEIGSVLGANIASEIAGRSFITKSVLGGASARSFGTGFAQVGRAGLVEGTLVDVAKSEREFKDDINLGEVSESAYMGGLTAGLIGGGMTWSGRSGKLSKVLEYGGYLSDPFEKPGDVLADVAERLLPGVSKITGRVRPKSFIFTETKMDGGKVKTDIDISKVENFRTLPSGAMEITYGTGKNKRVIFVESSPSNIKQMKDVSSYINKEQALLRPKSKAMTQEQIKTKTASDVETQRRDVPIGETNLLDTFSSSKTQVESESKIPTLSETSVLSESQVGTNVQSEVLTDSNVLVSEKVESLSQSQTQPQSQVLSETFTQSQVATQAQVPTYSGWLPTGYGRVTLPKGFGGFGGMQRFSGYVTDNKILDYAGAFFKRQQSKQSQLQQPLNKTNNISPAKKAANRMFGANISSGNKFRKYFGDAIKKK